MSDWWIVGIAYAAVFVCVVLLWFFVFRHLRSPSKELHDDAAQGLEEGLRRYRADELEVVAGRPGLAGCPVCGKPISEVGVTHRFEIKGDVRRCWTP